MTTYQHTCMHHATAAQAIPRLLADQPLRHQHLSHLGLAHLPALVAQHAAQHQVHKLAVIQLRAVGGQLRQAGPEWEG